METQILSLGKKIDKYYSIDLICRKERETKNNKTSEKLYMFS